MNPRRNLLAYRPQEERIPLPPLFFLSSINKFGAVMRENSIFVAGQYGVILKREKCRVRSKKQRGLERAKVEATLRILGR